MISRHVRKFALWQGFSAGVTTMSGGAALADLIGLRAMGMLILSWGSVQASVNAYLSAISVRAPYDAQNDRSASTQ